jgi:hypothetical protein
VTLHVPVPGTLSSSIFHVVPSSLLVHISLPAVKRIALPSAYTSDCIRSGVPAMLPVPFVSSAHDPPPSVLRQSDEHAGKRTGG